MALKTVLASSVLALFAMTLSASATTVSLQYDDPSAVNPQTATITVTAPGVALGPQLVGAYGFNMTDTSEQMGSSLAWCVDVSHYLGTTGSNSYTNTDEPFDSSYGFDAGQMTRVQSVFDANFAALDATSGNEPPGSSWRYGTRFTTPTGW
jgi:hypothetical protein